MEGIKNYEDFINEMNFSSNVSKLVLLSLTNPLKLEEDQRKNLSDALVAKGTTVGMDRNIARICKEICEKEAGLNIDSKNCFRSFLLSTLQTKYKQHVSDDYKNIEEWILFVGFLCAIFDLLRLSNMPLMALVKPVIGALMSLADTKRNKDEKVIQCLVRQLQFVGEDLDHLNTNEIDALFEKLENCFLDSDSTQLSRLILLEIIELRYGGWKISKSAYNYYYQN